MSTLSTTRSAVIATCPHCNVRQCLYYVSALRGGIGWGCTPCHITLPGS